MLYHIRYIELFMTIYVQMNNKSYRKGVGIIIVNSDLQFFLGKRIGANAWQFPQGGIDEGETPEDALYRELYEETGLEKDKIEVLDKSKKWLVYHIPHVFQRSNFLKQYDNDLSLIYFLCHQTHHQFLS